MLIFYMFRNRGTNLKAFFRSKEYNLNTLIEVLSPLLELSKCYNPTRHKMDKHKFTVL